MSDDELREWAEKVEADREGRPAQQFVVGIERLSVAVLRLLAEKQAHIEASAALKIENEQLKESLAAFAERVHAQSELLSRKAEKIDANQVFRFGMSDDGKMWVDGKPVGVSEGSD